MVNVVWTPPHHTTTLHTPFHSRRAQTAQVGDAIDKTFVILRDAALTYNLACVSNSAFVCTVKKHVSCSPTVSMKCEVFKILRWTGQEVNGTRAPTNKQTGKECREFQAQRDENVNWWTMHNASRLIEGDFEQMVKEGLQCMLVKLFARNAAWLKFDTKQERLQESIFTVEVIGCRRITIWKGTKILQQPKFERALRLFSISVFAVSLISYGILVPVRTSFDLRQRRE